MDELDCIDCTEEKMCTDCANAEYFFWVDEMERDDPYYWD